MLFKVRDFIFFTFISVYIVIIILQAWQMNPLTKFLRTLRRPSTAWHIIIDPNPREHLGFQPIAQPGVYKFTLNLFRGVYLDRYIQDFPSCAGASNITFCLPPKPLQSQWLSIFHTNLKNEKGESVPDVLINILEKFPSYDLETREGSKAAIHDLENRLNSISGIASFEELVQKPRDQKSGAKRPLGRHSGRFSYIRRGCPPVCGSLLLSSQS